MRSRSLACLALAIIFFAVAPAHASPRLTGVPARVAAGSDLHLTWVDLGPRVEEVELELSLDGGRWVRISRELDAREGEFTWRVPDGLTGLARLRLRFGGGGFEAEGDVSSAFVIEAKGDEVPPGSAMGPGDWWRLGRGGRAPQRELAGETSLRMAEPAVAIDATPRFVSRADVPARWTRTHSISFAATPAARTRDALPRHYPLRN